MEPGTADYPLLLNGTDCELQKFLMLAPFVTGKTAAQQQPKLNAFLEQLERKVDAPTPFAAIRRLTPFELRTLLEDVKAGQYTRLTKALRDLAFADLRWSWRTCSRDEMIRLHGISMKSASFFLVYTRDADMAVWDTHLLKWAQGRDEFPSQMPKSTPPRRLYLDLEKIYLDVCRNEGKRPYELDWEIWSAYRRKPK